MTRLAERLYAAILHLYPPSFRRAFGAEMRRCASDTLHRRGLAGVPRLAGDLAISLLREWTLALPSPRTTGVFRDLAYAVRILLRSPRFTAAAVLSLALGIGATTAIFTLMDATLLHPVRVDDPDRLVSYQGSFSYPDYRAIANGTSQVFTGFLGTSGSGRLSARIDSSMEILAPSFVSGNYFSVLGVRPALGRTLMPSDDVDGAPIVGVLTDDWYRARFAADPSVVGRTIWISGEPVTIVGVTPAGFRGTLLGAPRLFVPLASTPRLRTGFFSRPQVLASGDFNFISAVGRLRPGVSPQQAGAVIDALLASRHPAQSNTQPDAHPLMPLAERALGGESAASVKNFVWMLLGVVATTLLIGCANLANLLLARGAARRRELTVRLALGASRARIVRQLLAESLVLATAGAAAGLYVADISLQALARYQLPGGIEIDNLHLGIGGPALLFTSLLTVTTTLLFGIVPAIRASASRPIDLVRSGSRTATGGGALRAWLVGLQVALSVLLLAGSALFLQSLTRALRVPLGFDVEHVATVSVNLEAARYDRARAAQFYEETTARVRQLPGVRAAAWTTVVPIAGASMWTLELEGVPGGAPGGATFYNSDVAPGYFAAAGTRIIEGRPFAETDTAAAVPVAIVNDVASRRFWNGRPLGHRIRLGGRGSWATVVGVAENTKANDLAEAPEPFVFIPLAQRDDARLDNVSLLVRVEGDASAALPMVSAAVQGVAPEVPLYRVETFADSVRELVMPMRMGAALLSGFAALALTLALVGVYGVTACAAAQRTREIGIRLALGARRAEIVALVLQQGAVPIAAGIAAGIIGALWSGRLASGFLFQVSPRDPITLAVVSAGVAAVATAANYIPARRAARLDPVVTLRDD